MQLTTAWSISAAFEHLWTPALKTSWYGSYIDMSHNAAGNFLICNAGGGIYPAAAVAAGVCDFRLQPDWSSWNVGSRTQWEPVKGLIMGIDVIYNRLNSAPVNATGLVNLTVLAAIRPPAQQTLAALCRSRLACPAIGSQTRTL